MGWFLLLAAILLFLHANQECRCHARSIATSATVTKLEQLARSDPRLIALAWRLKGGQRIVGMISVSEYVGLAYGGINSWETIRRLRLKAVLVALLSNRDARSQTQSWVHHQISHA